MTTVQHVLIHEYTTTDEPSFDDEGDIRLGCYYQFVDIDNRPLSDIIGPYRTLKMAEKAAHQAYLSNDF